MFTLNIFQSHYQINAIFFFIATPILGLCAFNYILHILGISNFSLFEFSL